MMQFRPPVLFTPRNMPARSVERLAFSCPIAFLMPASGRVERDDGNAHIRAVNDVFLAGGDRLVGWGEDGAARLWTRSCTARFAAVPADRSGVK
jgi:hypothetical protein